MGTPDFLFHRKLFSYEIKNAPRRRKMSGRHLLCAHRSGMEIALRRNGSFPAGIAGQGILCPNRMFCKKTEGCRTAFPAITSSERINRETGEIPVRSRHCVRELRGRDMPLGVSAFRLMRPEDREKRPGRRRGALILSQENCLQQIQV